MRTGIDVDGVLADFNQEWAKVAKVLFDPGGFRISTTAPPTDWNLARSYNLSAEQEKAVWEEFVNRESWRYLDVLPGAKDGMLRLTRIPGDLYFITTRVGKDAKRQTEEWLMENSYLRAATVVVARNKWSIVNALELDVYIDDYAEGIEAILEGDHPPKRLYMVQWPYNEAWQKDLGARGVKLVKDFSVMMRWEGFL